MPDLPCGEEPRKVPFEADQASIDQVRLEMQNQLQIGSVVGDRWRGHPFRCKGEIFLSSLLPGCEWSQRLSLPQYEAVARTGQVCVPQCRTA